MPEKQVQWEWEINSKSSWLGASLKELSNYKDLLLQMVRKNFVLYYQQTLLGPLWMVINPLLTVYVYILIFNKIIGVSTEGVPAFAFYLTGVTLWTLFIDIFNGTSNIFSHHAYIFSKVYFPRIIVPLSTTLLHLLRFSIQLLILVIVLIYYHIAGEIELSVTRILVFLPTVVLMSAIALGLGLLLSVLTAKYKDVSNLMTLFTRLLMFICPVFYSLSIVPKDMRWFVNINPMSPLFELFRFAFIGKGYFSVEQIVFSTFSAFLLLAIGILLFNKLGDKLIDVV